MYRYCEEQYPPNDSTDKSISFSALPVNGRFGHVSHFAISQVCNRYFVKCVNNFSAILKQKLIPLKRFNVQTFF